ncbi:DUF4282 domain-containing protein [Myxococcota bacterium]|nr:DUF4282 domain-containing protein [Myxococcota bacterium]
MSDQVGFFSALLDLSFSNFVTTKIIKVVYVLLLIGVVLGALGMAATGLVALLEEELAGAVMILASPFALGIGILLVRVYMELVIVLFRVAEYAGEIAQNTRR